MEYAYYYVILIEGELDKVVNSYTLLEVHDLLQMPVTRVYSSWPAAAAASILELMNTDILIPESVEVRWTTTHEMASGTNEYTYSFVDAKQGDVKVIVHQVPVSH